LKQEGKILQKRVVRSPLRVKKKKRVSKERKIDPLKRKERKQYVNIVPKRVTTNLIVGSFISRRDLKKSTTKENKRQLQSFKRI